MVKKVVCGREGFIVTGNLKVFFQNVIYCGIQKMEIVFSFQLAVGNVSMIKCLYD